MKILLTYSFHTTFFTGQNVKRVQVIYNFNWKKSSGAEWEGYHSIHSSKRLKKVKK